MPRGQKTKLTSIMQDRICQLLRAGCYAERAAAASGIDQSTFYRWLQRGEQEEDGLYREFRDAVKSAEAEAEARAVTIIQLAMPGDWKAAMTWLERKFPERWARRERMHLEHTGPGGGPMQVQTAETILGLTDEDRAVIRALRQRVAASARTDPIDMLALPGGEE
jgi:hypothetical protein